MSKNILKILLVVTVGLSLSGCVGTYVKNRAIEYGDTKLAEFAEGQSQKAIASAIAEGYKETDIDPNLDGLVEWSEWTEFQKTAQSDILKGALADFRSGSSFDEIKEKVLSKQETLGLTGGMSGLAVFLLHMYRNRTRKKVLGEPKKT